MLSMVALLLNAAPLVHYCLFALRHRCHPCTPDSTSSSTAAHLAAHGHDVEGFAVCVGGRWPRHHLACDGGAQGSSSDECSS